MSFTPQFIGINSFKVNLAGELLRNLCLNLNAIVSKWNETFKEIPTSEQIKEVLATKVKDVYLKEKYLQGEQFNTVRAFSINAIITAHMVEFPDFSSLIDSFKLINGLLTDLNVKCAGTITDIEDLRDGNRYQVNESLNEAILERYSEYTVSIEQNQVLAIIQKLCDAVNDLNCLGAEIFLQETKFDSFVKATKTDIPQSVFGKEWKTGTVTNYVPAYNLFSGPRSGLAIRIAENINIQV